MQSSQDVGYVPFARQRRKPPVDVSTLEGFSISSNPPVPLVAGKGPPPPAPIPAPDEKGAGILGSITDGSTMTYSNSVPRSAIHNLGAAFSSKLSDRGRTNYRPDTMGKAISGHPVPADPPNISRGSAGRSSRRSHSSPPSGAAEKEFDVDPSNPDLAVAVKDEGIGSSVGAQERKFASTTNNETSTDSSTPPTSEPSPTTDLDSDFVFVHDEAGDISIDTEGAVGALSRVHRVDFIMFPPPSAGPVKAVRKPRFGTPPVVPSQETRIREAMDNEQIAEVNEMGLRRREAEEMLSSKQKRQIVKEEVKNNKALSRIIKEEGKMEKKTITMTVSELEDLQRAHKQSMKLEGKAMANHSKALGTYNKLLSSLDEAKKKYQGLEGKVQSAATQLQQATESLSDHKERVLEALDRVEEKQVEVDNLRRQFGVEAKERVLALDDLKSGVDTSPMEGSVSMIKQKASHRKSRFGSLKV
ncbi:hypothetical protein DFP72DRAFT_248816 [Ephemerocybe angulata]|uniref:Uncharacterized protein n=1 Tax=Ephemerocybe angulata TaxID=980116 RepID=A0A8H6I3E1_9AGAR|nr:hypothetical protein DFP72DRAFT_248816 [Tulosesus angulatus]